ncbi:hypothetical protein [Ramlibacter ginsenosidimutans]|uniref:hypothetical protein n=1 Tax=Ramlibacter ginsenosidimutans TaxID=502333 RepID=UPI003636411C
MALVCGAGDGALAITAFLKRLGMSVVSIGAGGATSAAALEPLRSVDFAVLAHPDRPLEAGFLLGALGASRVCLLLAGPSATPELEALTRINFDGSGVWKLLLARELRQAGLPVDLNLAL